MFVMLYPLVTVSVILNQYCVSKFRLIPETITSVVPPEYVEPYDVNPMVTSPGVLPVLYETVKSFGEFMLANLIFRDIYYFI